MFVHGDNVLHPCGLQHLDDGGARRPRAVLHHPDPADVLADDLEGIEYTGQHDDGGAVLVVMEYRNIQIPFQFGFDLKAFGAADVFQVDAAESGGDRLDRRHHLLLGGGVQTDGERIHAAELLEQNALALHDRQAGFGADVAEPQHGSAVGDHRDGAAFEGIAIDIFGVFGDLAAGFGHAGGVGRGERVPVLDRKQAFYGKFAVVFFVHGKGCGIVVHGAHPFFIHCVKGSHPRVCKSDASLSFAAP